MTFQNIDHDSVTDTYLTVNYHTGFLCVGKDWWWLSWADSNGYVHTIEPKDNRCIIDQVEGIIRKVANVASISGPHGRVMNEVLKYVTNDESTCGFKEHMLVSEDDNAYVNVTLHPHTNNGIDIESPSGKSTTDYSSKKLSITHDEH